MANRIQYRRDTAANWTAANPVLALGEPGYETDTGKRKTGDGVTAWTGLPYQLDKSTADATYSKARNLNAPSYPSWRKALAKVRAGTGDAKVLCIGDSTTWGYGTAAAIPPMASWPALLPTFLTNALNAPAAVGMGITCAMSGNAIDNRWNGGTFPTGWTFENSNNGWGNCCFKAAASAAALVYTPGGTASYDTFDVYYVATGASSAFTIQATGGSLVTVTPGAQNGIFKATCAAGSAGTGNAVTITMANGGRICGVEPSLSTAKRVRVANAGMSGSTAHGWASNQPYASIPNIKAYAPDLTIICLGINDSSSSLWTGEFPTNVQLLIDAAKVSGDVLLVTFVPSQNDGTNGPNQTIILGNYQTLSASAKVGLVDVNSRWVSYAVSSAAGLTFDTLHPNAIGYYDVADAIFDGIRNIR